MRCMPRSTASESPGMPEPYSLPRLSVDRGTMVTERTWLRFDSGDIGIRNLDVLTLANAPQMHRGRLLLHDHGGLGVDAASLDLQQGLR